LQEGVSRERSASGRGSRRSSGGFAGFNLPAVPASRARGSRLDAAAAAARRRRDS
jgi:hypothetical protein